MAETIAPRNSPKVEGEDFMKCQRCNSQFHGLSKCPEETVHMLKEIKQSMNEISKRCEEFEKQ